MDKAAHENAHANSMMINKYTKYQNFCMQFFVSYVHK